MFELIKEDIEGMLKVVLEWIRFNIFFSEFIDDSDEWMWKRKIVISIIILLF